MKDYNFYVYILTRERNSVFYVGVTNDLIIRISEHKAKLIGGFTKKYNVTKLVYYEHHSDIYEAIYREKIIKKWKRRYKIRAIESMNPQWNDLYEELISAKKSDDLA